MVEQDDVKCDRQYQMLLTDPAITAASLADGRTRADQKRPLGRPCRWIDCACMPTGALTAGRSFQGKKLAGGRPASN